MPNQSSAPDVPRLSVSTSAAASKRQRQQQRQRQCRARLCGGRQNHQQHDAHRDRQDDAGLREPAVVAARPQPERPQRKRQRRPGEPRQVLQIVERLDRRRSGGEAEEARDALSVPPKHQNRGIAQIHRQRPRDQQRRGNEHGERERRGVTARAPLRESNQQQRAQCDHHRPRRAPDQECDACARAEQRARDQRAPRRHRQCIERQRVRRQQAYFRRERMGAIPQPYAPDEHQDREPAKGAPVEFATGERTAATGSIRGKARWQRARRRAMRAKFAAPRRSPQPAHRRAAGAPMPARRQVAAPASRRCSAHRGQRRMSSHHRVSRDRARTSRAESTPRRATPVPPV